MAIVIEDLQMERLAQQIARAEGLSVIEVVREGLLSLAGMRGLTAKKSPLRERLTKLAREIDALPHRASVDHHSDNDILGYNEHGTW